MLYCKCGFTCGTQAALERHIAKFADSDVASLHALDVEPHLPRPGTGTKTAASLKFSRRAENADGYGSDVDNSPAARSDGPMSPMTPLSPTTPTPLRHRRPHSGSSSDLGTPARSGILSRAGSSTMSLGAFVNGSSPTSFGGASPSSSSRVRVLFVRHAQSANKARRPGQRASLDPELTDLGYEQADALAAKFARQFTPDMFGRGVVQIVSSPMRRCLLTIQPTVRKLKMPREICFCHGSFYEFGCAGTGRATSSPADINYEFPEFQPVGFSPEGRWDYRGCNAKESEEDCRERCVRIADWLHTEACTALRARGVGREVPTLIFVTHQTVADLLCQVLVDGTASMWSYGEIHNKLCNAGVTEVFCYGDGTARFGNRNDDNHLFALSSMGRCG